MSSEQAVQQLIRLAASDNGVHLWRNNSGMLYNQDGVPVRYGLGNDSAKINKRLKSSDLIGITPIVVTPEMVGATVGIFTAIEVKRSSWKWRATQEEIAQNNYIELVIRNGGIGAFINDVDQFKSFMRFNK